MPLAHWRSYRERARQKRKALHMLALSGVIRPSHIELRYTIPTLKAATTKMSLRTIPAGPPQPSIFHTEPSETVKPRGIQLLEWLRQGLTASR